MTVRLLLLLAALAALPLAAPAQDKAKPEAQAEADETLSAIVRVKTKIVPNARSAATLGLQREGSGVLVREGYVVTIGYLVIESESIEITSAEGKSVPAALAGYDHASGFGLLKLLAPLAGKPLPLGESGALAEREPAMIASYGGRDAVNVVHVVSRRPFSGSWEYLLDSAIFTYPPVMNWSGASLISAKGELLGIGSLIVPDAGGPGTQSPGNMFVPIDLLKPKLGDLIATGRVSGKPRPWLGINTQEVQGNVIVTRVSPESPAEQASLKTGDIIVGLGGQAIKGQADFYTRIWSHGEAGVDIPLDVLRGGRVEPVSVKSVDRDQYLRPKPTY